MSTPRSIDLLPHQQSFTAQNSTPTNFATGHTQSPGNAVPATMDSLSSSDFELANYLGSDLQPDLGYRRQHVTQPHRQSSHKQVKNIGYAVNSRRQRHHQAGQNQSGMTATPMQGPMQSSVQNSMQGSMQHVSPEMQSSAPRKQKRTNMSLENFHLNPQDIQSFLMITPPIVEYSPYYYMMSMSGNSPDSAANVATSVAAQAQPSGQAQSALSQSQSSQPPVQPQVQPPQPQAAVDSVGSQSASYGQISQSVEQPYQGSTYANVGENLAMNVGQQPRAQPQPQPQPPYAVSGNVNEGLASSSVPPNMFAENLGQPVDAPVNSTGTSGAPPPNAAGTASVAPSYHPQPRRRVSISNGQIGQISQIVHRETGQAAPEPSATPDANQRHSVVYWPDGENESNSAPGTTTRPAIGSRIKVNKDGVPEKPLIYNNEVIFNPNAGPIPGTAAWKRQRILERNRIAASKCRQKKKNLQRRLQQDVETLRKKNQYLEEVLLALTGKVSSYMETNDVGFDKIFGEGNEEFVRGEVLNGVRVKREDSTVKSVKKHRGRQRHQRNAGVDSPDYSVRISTKTLRRVLHSRREDLYDGMDGSVKRAMN